MAEISKKLNLIQSTAINITNMVGIGPFICMTAIMQAAKGSNCLLCWLIGGVIALLDGYVWAKLSSRWPVAGGSFIYLRNLYPANMGKLLSFLFLWQAIIAMPLMIATGVIGFSSNFAYIDPAISFKITAVILVIIVTILLFRNIHEIGVISTVFGYLVIITICWAIFAGISSFNLLHVFAGSGSRFLKAQPSSLSNAINAIIYCFIGYSNTCYIGAEIKNPAKNIPRSIYLSIIIVAVLYFFMQAAVLSQPIPHGSTDNYPFFNNFFQQKYNHSVSVFFTVLVLIVAASATFSALLGFSRVPYAAAKEGHFFKLFGTTNSKKTVPVFSILFLCLLTLIFSVAFDLDSIIKLVVALQLCLQYIAQSIGLIVYYLRNPGLISGFRGKLRLLVPVAVTIIWVALFILFESDSFYYVLAIMGIGTLLFYVTGIYKKPNLAHYETGIPAAIRYSNKEAEV